MSTKAGGSDHLFLFIYENSFFLDIVFRCNIKYLFIYLLKAMSTEAVGSDDLYLLMKITCCEKCFSFLYSAVADLRGSAWDAPPPPPGGPNSFDFMQFLGNFGKIVCWGPTWGFGATSSGKSCIRHCSVYIYLFKAM